MSIIQVTHPILLCKFQCTLGSLIPLSGRSTTGTFGIFGTATPNVSVMGRQINNLITSNAGGTFDFRLELGGAGGLVQSSLSRMIIENSSGVFQVIEMSSASTFSGAGPNTWEWNDGTIGKVWTLADVGNVRWVEIYT